MLDQPSNRASGSASERRAVIGLGNPGAAYEATRHNLGFRVIDALHGRLGGEVWRDECGARVARVEAADLVKPQTFMNRSGHAARCLAELHGYEPGRILVVYDDIALPLGTLRLRPAGGPGGHRGLASVIASMRTDQVPRLRLGIAPGGEPPAEDLAEFVLRPFGQPEEAVVARLVSRAADACLAWLEHGTEATMNAFNGPLPVPPTTGEGADLPEGGAAEGAGP